MRYSSWTQVVATPMVRYNATPEENIELVDNLSPLREDFDPSTGGATPIAVTAVASP